MKRIRLLSNISVTVLSCTLGSVVVQAGPVRPSLKSVVYKMVGGSQVSPYDLSARERRLTRSPSPSSINPGDGQLPSTSGAASSLRLATMSGTGGSKEKRNKRVGELEAGESIYLPTRDNKNRIIRKAGPRPHLIVEIKADREWVSASKLTLLDMSRLNGKEEKVYNKKHASQFHVITQSGSGFEGRNASFVKLQTMRTVTFPNIDRKVTLKRRVSPEELKIIREKLKLKD